MVVVVVGGPGHFTVSTGTGRSFDSRFSFLDSWFSILYSIPRSQASKPSPSRLTIVNIKYYKFQISEKSNSARIFNSQVANGWQCCCFLRMQNKVVTMTFSSNYSGQDPKEGTRSDTFYFSDTNLTWYHLSELILDEHVECGCQCTPGDQCIFNFHEKYFHFLRSTLQLRRNIWWKNLWVRM